MAITQTCPNCEARLSFKDERCVGKRFACPKCKQPFDVRRADDVAAFDPLVDAQPGDSPDFGLDGLEELLPPASPSSSNFYTAPPTDWSPKQKPPDKAAKAAPPGKQKMRKSKTDRPMVVFAGGILGGLAVLASIALGVRMVWIGLMPAPPELSAESLMLTTEFKFLLGSRKQNDFGSLTEVFKALDPQLLQTTPKEERKLRAQTALRDTQAITAKQVAFAKELEHPLEFQNMQLFFDNWKSASEDPKKKNILDELRLRLIAIELRQVVLKMERPLDEAQLKMFKEVEDLAYGQHSLFKNWPELPPPPSVSAVLLAPRLEAVARGLTGFYDTNSSFPTAFGLRTARARGLSWRVWLLPYVGQQELFQKFDLNQAWDSEANLGLIAQMPTVYQTSGVNEAGFTSVHLLGGDMAIASEKHPGQLSSISDGTARTILCVVAGPAAATQWTRPGLLEIDPSQDPTWLDSVKDTLLPSIMADGSLKFLNGKIEPEMLATLVHCADGLPRVTELRAMQHERSTDKCLTLRYKLFDMLPDEYRAQLTASNKGSASGREQKGSAESQTSAVLPTVLGFDVVQRERLVDYLQQQGMNRPKAKVRLLFTVNGLKKFATALGCKADGQGEIHPPADFERYREKFDAGDIPDQLLQSEAMPSDFSQLIADYQNDKLSDSERDLAYFVILAYLGSEL